MDFVATHIHKNTNRRYTLVNSEAYLSTRSGIFAGYILTDEAGVCWALTQDEFEQKFQVITRLEDLDVDEVIKAFLAGELKPMSELSRQEWKVKIGHTDFCLCGDVGGLFVTVAWKEEAACWSCRAHLGARTALVDLKDGTWEEV